MTASDTHVCEVCCHRQAYSDNYNTTTITTTSTTSTIEIIGELEF